MAGMIKPKRLGPGSTIAIVAPAFPPKPDRLPVSIELLKKHGYKVREFPQIRKRFGYLAGTDKERAKALMDSFQDYAIDGIFCARGGYGGIRLLSHLDFDIIRKHPKPLVGYSDITTLLLAIHAKCDMVTFHGPLLAVEFGKRHGLFTREHFFRAMESNEPLGKIDIPKTYKPGCINRGKVSGPIVGGNLSLICKLAGTEFLPSFKDKIVFFEDTDEEPYRIDGYLAQLFLATDFADAKGYLIGEFINCSPKRHLAGTWCITDVLEDYLSKLGKPVIYNYPCGHGREKITIPIGVEAAIDSGRGILEIKEAGVI